MKAKSFLFPSDLKVGRVAPKRGGKNQKNPKGNGGWGDHRDRALCLNMATSSAKNRTNLSQQVIKDLNLNWLTTKMHAANKYPHLTQSLSPTVAWMTMLAFRKFWVHEGYFNVGDCISGMQLLLIKQKIKGSTWCFVVTSAVWRWTNTSYFHTDFINHIIDQKCAAAKEISTRIMDYNRSKRSLFTCSSIDNNMFHNLLVCLECNPWKVQQLLKMLKPD